MENRKGFVDLSRYQLLYPIGSGAFSKVFRVKSLDTNEYYAAKVSLFMVNEDTKDNIETLSFFREINLMYMLKYPSILRFIGYSENDFEGNPNPTILTEFATNGSLKNILEMEMSGLSPNDWNDTKKIINVYGIACGLAYLHSHSIIHRDLKPENIFIDEYLFPKIADFGLSKINDILSVSMNIQSQKGLKGTPIYMAPEVLSDEKYSEFSDVYAFGIIVYEIFTGKTPFSNLTIQQIFKKVMMQGYRPEISDDVPFAYQKLIENCWAQDPENRPSFLQIVNDLRENAEYITNMMDESEFFDYVDYIDNFKSNFNASNRLIHFEDFIKANGRNKTIKKVIINEDFAKNENDNEQDNILNQNKNENSININEINLDKEVKDDEDLNDNEEKNDKNSKLKKDNDEDLLKIKEAKDSKKDTQVKKVDDNNSIDRKANDDEYPKIIGESNDKIQETIENESIYPIVEFVKLDEKCKSLVEKAKNDPDAQFIVGKSLIENENNFPSNIVLGFKYLELSISQKYLESMIYYVKLLIKGELTPQDIEKAEQYLQKNLNSFSDSRLYVLKGQILRKKKKYSEAKNSFEQGAKAGNNESMYKYAKMLFLGEGTKKDDNKAFNYFDLSQKHGYIKGQYFLTIFKKMNTIKGFKDLPVETQYFIISNGIKNSRSNNGQRQSKFELDQIKIKPINTDKLFFNNSLKTPNFINCLNIFKNVVIEVQYSSQSFDSKIDLIKKIKKKNNNIKIGIVFSIFPIKLDSTINSKIIDYFRIDSSVKIVPNKSFIKYSLLTNVIISPFTSEIGESAFGDCNLLENIIIPSSVIKINNDAFGRCTSLKQINFPLSITYMGKMAFVFCKSLRQITIPSSVTKIDDFAFKMCNSLENIIFSVPSSIKTIGQWCFGQCKSLKQITIPSSVINIDSWCFVNCTSLEEVKFDSPSSLTEIPFECFKNCTSLKNMIFPSSVQKIDCQSFKQCSSLELVLFDSNSSLTEAEYGVFLNCKSLKRIVFPSSLIKLGYCVFENCSSLEQVLFDKPSSLTEIGLHCFKNCRSLKQIEIPSAADVYNSFPNKTKVIKT